MKFQTKLYLFFALTVILPICLVTVLVAFSFSRISSQTAQNRLQDAVQLASVSVTVQSDILSAVLTQKLKSQPGLLSVAVSKKPALLEASLEHLKQELGANSVALYAEDGSVIKENAGPPQENQCLAASRIPLKEGGSLWGYVAVSKNLDDSFLNNVLGGAGLEAAVYCGGETRASTFVGADKPEFEMPSTANTDTPEDNIREIKIAEKDYLTYQYLIQPQPPGEPILLVAGIPTEEIVGRRTLVLEIGFSLVAFTIVVAGLLGYLVTRSITDPLHILTNAVLKAEAGDLSCNVNIESRDEIGLLARNFTRMCGQIRRFIQQLQESHFRLLKAFTYAGDLLGSSYDREKLLRTVTDTVALATNASAVGFYLMDGSIGMGLSRGRIRAVQQSPANFFTPARKQIIEAAVQQIKSGAIKNLTARHLDDNYQFIVAPIAINDNILGALVAVLDPSQDIEKSSYSVLQSLANQTATALENVRLKDALEEMVITDALTGLRNIRYFTDRFASEIELSRRHSNPLSLLVIDLDNFKQVNDTYGHQVGDDVLRQVGYLLNHNVRKSDIAARYGGEEFVIILPQTLKDTAVEVAEKLRQKAQQLRIIHYPKVRVSFSIGVASFPEDASNDYDLLQMADSATYRAKDLGKNRTVAA